MFVPSLAKDKIMSMVTLTGDGLLIFLQTQRWKIAGIAGIQPTILDFRSHSGVFDLSQPRPPIPISSSRSEASEELDFVLH